MGKIYQVPLLEELTQQLIQQKAYDIEGSGGRVVTAGGVYTFQGNGIDISFTDLRSLYKHLDRLVEGSVTQNKKMQKASQRLHAGGFSAYEGVKLGFDALGLEIRRTSIERRFGNSRNLIKDYGVIGSMWESLGGMIETEASTEDFKRQVRRKKKELEIREIDGLHAQWLAQGGRLEIELQPGETYPDLERVLTAMVHGAQIASGGGGVESEVYGAIEPSLLNNGLEAFRGNRGQIMLLAALSVATGHHDYPLAQFSPILNKLKVDRKRLDWNVISVDWRRGLVTDLRKDEIFKPGLEGYYNFSRDYTDGDMKKGYALASRLLSQEEFSRLGWDKALQIRIDQFEAYPKGFLPDLADVNIEAEEDRDDGSLGVSAEIKASDLAQNPENIDPAVIDLGYVLDLFEEVDTSLEIEILPLSELAEHLTQQQEYVFEGTGARIVAVDGVYNFEGNDIHVSFRNLRSLYRHLERLVRGSATQNKRMQEASRRLRKGKLGFYEGVQLGFEVLGLVKTRVEFEQRYNHQNNLINDYGVIEIARVDLGGLVETQGSVEELTRQVRKKKKALEKRELNGLNAQWLTQGGRLEIELQAGQDYPDLETVLRAMAEGAQIVSGGGVVESDVYGPIDTQNLNRGLDYFKGNEGQVMLLGALGVVTGKLDYNLQSISRILKSIHRTMNSLDWNVIGTDWRRSRLIILNKDTIFKPGMEGYMEFSREYADGDMLKGYHLASSFLSKEAFNRLGWGKVIALKVEQVSEYQEVLRMGLADGTLIGIDGYKKFSEKYVRSNLKKGYLLASALLTREEFKALGWPKAIYLKVEQVSEYQEILRRGLADGTLIGREGYKRFSRKYAGRKMWKGYKLASALLSETEFKNLNWGKAIHLEVGEVKRYEQILRKGLADGSLKGRDGYRKFSNLYANGYMTKGYQLASSLLSDEDFDLLDWGQMIPLREDQVDAYQQVLQRGIDDESLMGEDGCKSFSKKYADGSTSKGYIIASAMLKNEFEKLGWQWREVANLKLVVQDGQETWVKSKDFNQPWEMPQPSSTRSETKRRSGSEGVSVRERNQATTTTRSSSASQSSQVLKVAPVHVSDTDEPKSKLATHLEAILQLSPEVKMLLIETREYLLAHGCEASAQYIAEFLRKPTRLGYGQLMAEGYGIMEIAQVVMEHVGEKIILDQRTVKGVMGPYGRGAVMGGTLTTLLYR